MDIFHMTQGFPKAETSSLIDQIRRSSRSVGANLAEAWEKRRYEPAFVAKLNDSCAEASETQNWLLYGLACDDIAEADRDRPLDSYDGILRTFHAMAQNADRWCRPAK